MPMQDPRGLLTIRSINHAFIVHFVSPELIDGDIVQYLGERLDRLAFEGGHFIVSFHGVKVLNSAILGKLLEVYKRVRRAGGRLVLCGVDPDGHLMEILRSSSLDRIFGVFPDEWSALKANQSPAPHGGTKPMAVR